MKENTIYLKSQETQQASVDEKLLAVMSLFTAYVFVRCFIPGHYGFLGMTVTLAVYRGVCFGRRLLFS